MRINGRIQFIAYAGHAHSIREPNDFLQVWSFDDSNLANKLVFRKFELFLQIFDGVAVIKNKLVLSNNCQSGLIAVKLEGS